MAPARRVLLLALASRALVLGAMALFGWAFPNLDSSARLGGFPCAADGSAATDAWAAAAAANPPVPSRLPLPVWDTVYFSRIAKCGYETDKLNAFFPLVPAAMRLVERLAGFVHARLLPAARLPPAEALHALAGLAASLAAFCAAALCLHRLGLRALGGGARGRRLADLSLLIFCANPASVFYSAAYSEALFAACTWAGLLLLPRRHWAGVAALAAAAAARSNGILGVWFPLHKLLAAWRRAPGGRLPWGEAARAAASCCVILAPYVAMQAQAYAAFCLPTTAAAAAGGALDRSSARPAWCDQALPSVYGWIQRAYWDVGFLRFYRDPARLPMVLMSLPVAWLSISGCWAYFSADWQRALTLGLYPRRQRLPRWLHAPAAVVRRAAAVRDARRSSGGGGRQQANSKAAAAGAGSALLASAEAAPLVYHWALMAAVALLAMHVNVATRFLSACPPLYWWAAEVVAAGGARSRALWLWCFAYIALGCLLFPNFYPWT